MERPDACGSFSSSSFQGELRQHVEIVQRKALGDFYMLTGEPVKYNHLPVYGSIALGILPLRPSTRTIRLGKMLGALLAQPFPHLSPFITDTSLLLFCLILFLYRSYILVLLICVEGNV